MVKVHVSAEDTSEISERALAEVELIVEPRNLTQPLFQFFNGFYYVAYGFHQFGDRSLRLF